LLGCTLEWQREKRSCLLRLHEPPTTTRAILTKTEVTVRANSKPRE
jgi:hypothetical protein